MKSEYFYCPKCNAKLTKSAAAFVMGETGQSDLAASTIPAVTCPACGADIDTKKMVEGKLDGTGNKFIEFIMFVIMFGLPIYMMVEHDYGFFSAFGIVWGIAIGICLLICIAKNIFGRS